MPYTVISPRWACRFAVCASLCSALLPTSLLAAAPVPAVADDDCLLRELKSAQPLTTAEELRRRCQPPPQPADPSATADTPKAAAPPPVVAMDRLLAKPPETLSLFERRVTSEVRASREPFALLPHRPNYLLPASYNLHDPGSGRDQLESHFQISFKFPLTPPLFEGRLLPYFAYTGRAWWQLYDGDRSRPFREYDHEPELLIGLPAAGTELLGWTHRATAIGLNHQSNGRSVPFSRSWNRFTAEVFLDRGLHTWAALKLWHRFSEDAKDDPQDSRGDDNPDITRYLGNFELKLGHAEPGSHNVTLTLRRSTRTDGKGAVQLDWSHPTGYAPELRWTAQLFSGYGDSLIDYNVKVQRIGVGIMLNDWF
jgi:phospholipase A1/A2